MPARPPPNRVAKVCWKFALIAVNASRNRTCVVSSIRLMASLVWAIESMRSCRCVVRKPWRASSSVCCSMAIMFTGPIRSIFPRSSVMASSAVMCSGTGASAPSTAAASSSSGSATSAARMARASGSTTPAASMSDFLLDLVERRAHGIVGLLSQVREVGFGRGPGHVEAGGQGPNRIERAPRVPNHAFLGVEGGAEFGRPLVRDTHLVAQRFERSDVGVEVLLVLGNAGQQPLALVAHLGNVLELDSTRRSNSTAAASIRLTSAAAAAQRSTSVACAARASAAVWLAASACSAGRQQPLQRGHQRVVGRALVGIETHHRLPRFGLSGVEPRDFLTNPTNLDGHDDSARCCTRNSSCAARDTSASRETMPFSWRCISAAKASIAAVAWAIVRSHWAVSSARVASAARSVAMRSRSSLISRFVARMPRASALSPPITMWRPRKTSPSRVATGNGTNGATRDAVSNDSLIQASPMAARSAPENGPPMRTTSCRRTVPTGTSKFGLRGLNLRGSIPVG